MKNPFHSFIMQKRMCWVDPGTKKCYDWNPISRLNRVIDQAKQYTCELCGGWGHAATGKYIYFFHFVCLLVRMWHQAQY